MKNGIGKKRRFCSGLMDIKNIDLDEDDDTWFCLLFKLTNNIKKEHESQMKIFQPSKQSKFINFYKQNNFVFENKNGQKFQQHLLITVFFN